ncbi:S-adenosylmethionine decarboxylase [Candidatus Aerophobetes bacterium]|uniref:S-adenosylmethionine decarboxylase proenzyme n=1 Tax=Aerophobetes bacterium TaxID=2030807 RepID=A0A497E8F0_UNCAE|nr:S-adenosylmethionine decarboxylase [Candidatus Aerophobetes bacterium]RLE10605.1 MAG: S-adenosylmethionine decarboxylase [Candidatus Aerophobetes bacterium]
MIRRRDNFGIHIVSDLYGCDPEKLDNIKEIKKIIETAIEKANLTKIKSHFHQFEPYGVTGFALLSESHIAVHTWPEYGYVSLDVYSCGTPDSSFSAHKRIVDFFKPSKVSTNIFKRGKLDESYSKTNIETVSQRA